MSSPVVIALGGNLGDVRSAGKSALDRLSTTPGVDVVSVSPWYSTEPVGCEGRFLNAAARLHCDLTPTQLLRRMLEIETELGRTRTGHWTPRPMDLDLILFGEWRTQHPQLRLPHPAAWYRRFVLDPACDVASEMIHPDFGQTLSDLRSTLLRRPVTLNWSLDRPRDAVIDSSFNNPFGEFIHWVSSPESACVSFVAAGAPLPHTRSIMVPSDVTGARRVICETLTAVLDAPQIAGE